MKTGAAEVEYSDIYGEAFKTRNEGDYERFKFPTPDQAKEALENAERFVARIEKLLKEPK